MNFEEIVKAIEGKAASGNPLGNSLKFDFGDNSVFLDGKGDTNVVSANSANEADCTVEVSIENFTSMLSGDLNPMTAFMSGKIKVRGDMSVAMKLGTILG